MSRGCQTGLEMNRRRGHRKEGGKEKKKEGGGHTMTGSLLMCIARLTVYHA